MNANHNFSPAQVAEYWIAFQRLKREPGDSVFQSPEGSDLFDRAWVFAEWGLNDPELCWTTAIEIWNRIDHSDLELISILGAGEIEDLLSNFSDDYFPLIEKFCEVEPDFKTVLRMVWQSSMSQEL